MGEVKYFFLCEFSNKQIFVYAIKSSATDWHYFEEKDSVIKEHFSLPPDLKSRIFLLDKLLEVRVDLDCDQLENYLTDGKFVFKGKELRTCKFSLSQFVFPSIYYYFNPQIFSWLVKRLINIFQLEKKSQNQLTIWCLL